MSNAYTATAAFSHGTDKLASQPAFTLSKALRAPDEAADSGDGQDRGDTVIFSAQGRTMAARQAQVLDDTSDDSKTAAHIKQIKERITKLKQEIEEIQQDQTLSEEEKRQQLMAKQGELTELQSQLAEAYKEQAKTASSAKASANMTSLQSYGAKS